MARDPNKYREDEDLNEVDEEEDEEEFEGRPQQRERGDEDEIADAEEDSVESVRAGRRRS